MKKVFAVVAATGMMAVLSACACWTPVNEQCQIPVHKITSNIVPDALSINQVTVLPTRDAFRPTFTAGTKRISAIGKGFDRKQALKDAIAKLCIENDCDMIAAAKIVMVKTRHPHWIFWSYSTYQAHLTGLPMTMIGLVKEIRKEAPKPAPAKVIVKEVIKEVVKKEPAKSACPKCMPALIQLKDIKLSMTASADSLSKVAVKLPADCKTGR